MTDNVDFAILSVVNSKFWAGSSMVEHPAFNRVVVSSNLTQPTKFIMKVNDMADKSFNWMQQEFEVLTKPMIELASKTLKSDIAAKMRAGETLTKIFQDKEIQRKRFQITAHSAGVTKMHLVPDANNITAVDKNLKPVKIANVLVYPELNRGVGPSIAVSKNSTLDYSQTRLLLGLWTPQGDRICTISFEPSKALHKWFEHSFEKTSSQFHQTTTNNVDSKERSLGGIIIFHLLQDKDVKYTVYADKFDEVSDYLNYKTPGFAGNFHKIAGRFLDNFVGIKNVGVLPF